MIPDSKKQEWGAKMADLMKRKDVAAAQAREAVGEIDWAAYETILGADAVKKVKAEYATHKYTDFDAEAKAEKSALEKTQAEVVSSIASTQAEMSKHLGAAESQLAELESTRTDAETGYEDVAARFPELEAELERDVAEHNWDTEVDPVDVTAARVALIQERWNAKQFGRLDEDTQREFLDEIAAMEKRQASGAVSADSVSDAQMQDLKASLAQSGNPQLAALEPTKEQIASMAAGLSADDLALTRASDLVARVDECLEGMANPFMANKLLDRMQELRNRGKLEMDLDLPEDDAVAAREFDFASLEGLNSDELVAMAAKEKDPEVQTLIMLHDWRNSKGFDKTSTDMNGDGRVNAMWHELMGMREAAVEIKSQL
jgi:chromosome segregation ATPase